MLRAQAPPSSRRVAPATIASSVVTQPHPGLRMPEGARRARTAHTAANKDEQKAVFPGVLGWPLTYAPETMQVWTSSQIPSQATRWRGDNFGAYSNTSFDALYDQMVGTLDVPTRQSLLADLLKINADVAMSIYLYYDTATSTVAYRKGIVGVGPVAIAQLVNSWNIGAWD